MHPATTTQTRRRAGEALPRGRRAARRRGRGDGGADPRGGRRDRHERRRPARGDVDRAAVDLIARRGAEILAAARRYAATPEDAEDAYQRGLEILLRKAPSTSEEDLVPWLKTVVKHEAFALRRHRERHAPVTDDGELAERGTPADATHDQACRYELLRQGAEALRQLKSQEVRALRLRAEGYTYAEICQITGWTYTKVNRCLTEGRQALSVRLAGIQGGIECAKLAPLLSALADGEASAEQLARAGMLCNRSKVKSLLSVSGQPLREKPIQRGQGGGGPTMPVYVRAADSDRWHWCLNCSRYPWRAVTTGALFRSDRPPADLCKQCLRKEREGKCGKPP